MQVRLQGETAQTRVGAPPASDRRWLGSTSFARRSGKASVALDEAAQLVAAAVFPSAVQGLREVNVKLWDFEKIQWKRYTDILTDVVRRGNITPEQEVRIQAIADDVARAFGDVNTLLNDLAEGRSSDASALRRRLQQAPVKLTAALENASDRLTKASDVLSAFRPVIKASAKVADDVAKLLRRLTIPVFPNHDGLEDCCEVVGRPLYEGLSGVQAFALLNILRSCRRHVRRDGRSSRAAPRG